MRYRAIFTTALTLLLTLPAAALATGFAPSSIFLSKTNPTEGETVLVHTVVLNDSSQTFSGTLTLREGESPIGSTELSLEPGEAQATSISWKPSAGEHTVVAELIVDGTVLGETSAKFTIAAKPTAEEPVETDVESSESIQQSIRDVSPMIADGTGPVFALIDAARESVAGAVDGQIAQTKKSLQSKKTGEVAGAETSGSFMDSVWYVLYTLYLYLLTIIRYLVTTVAIFYPLLVIAFIWGMWKLYKRMSRPAWQR